MYRERRFQPKFCRVRAASVPIALLITDLPGTYRSATRARPRRSRRLGPLAEFARHAQCEPRRQPGESPREGQQMPTPKQLEQLWADHLAGEFQDKDVEATLATMVDDAYVNHMPVNTGGRGKDALRAFYRDDFIPSWPDDLAMTPLNRVVGEGQLVDELHLTFTHEKPMAWLLPNVPATHRKIAMDVVVVVQFRGDKLACERIY